MPVYPTSRFFFDDISDFLAVTLNPDATLYISLLVFCFQLATHML